MDEYLSIHPPLAVNQPCSLSALGRCVLHRLDDVSRSPLSGKQIHHSGIKSVANISAESGIHPQLHAIRLFHSFEDSLKIFIGNRIVSLGRSRNGAERSGVFLLI